MIKIISLLAIFQFVFLQAFSMKAIDKNQQEQIQKENIDRNKVGQMEIITLRGEEILPFLNEVAELRIKIFREWPYLYEGAFETEKVYLKVYANAEDSILVLAKDKDRIVGIAMGLPINESMEEVQRVFYEKQLPMDDCYYFADVILLKEYRKKKIGLKMIQDFECALTSLGNYEWIYFCEIIREKNDPRIPLNYRSLDSFWDSLGYPIVPNWKTYMGWLDIGSDEKVSHLMRFRRKQILN